MSSHISTQGSGSWNWLIIHFLAIDDRDLLKEDASKDLVDFPFVFRASPDS